ncbi:uncharacterized membrane protein YoaK (UPF0700 family) [Streptomyces aurantiacus]|nr:uncharacterized membrane protein YoaK (UPF0700 family) [Streptomyces aurantiacus]
MTGNVVILGMAATGGTDLPVLGPAVALVSFLAGAAVAGRVLRTADPGWGRRCTALLGGAGLVLAATAAGLAVTGVGAPGVRASMAASLALAMGTQAATARHLGVKDLTTVVVTSTLTGLAADSRLGAARGQGARRRVAAVPHRHSSGSDRLRPRSGSHARDGRGPGRRSRVNSPCAVLTRPP